MRIRMTTDRIAPRLTHRGSRLHEHHAPSSTNGQKVHSTNGVLRKSRSHVLVSTKMSARTTGSAALRRPGAWKYPRLGGVRAVMNTHERLAAAASQAARGMAANGPAAPVSV